MAAGTIAPGAPRDARRRRAGRRQGAAPDTPSEEIAGRPRAARAARRQGGRPRRSRDARRRRRRSSSTCRPRCAASSTSATRPPTSSACARCWRRSTASTCPRVHAELSTARLLVMEEVQGDPGARRAGRRGAPRRPAAQLLEAYYQQVLGDGFFHADPHPGNLHVVRGQGLPARPRAWSARSTPSCGSSMLLLLLAFWREDAAFLAEVMLALSAEPVGARLRRGRASVASSPSSSPNYRDLLAERTAARAAAASS